MKKRTKRTFSEAEIHNVIQDYKTDITIKALCEKNNINTDQLYQILASRDVPKRQPAMSAPRTFAHRGAKAKVEKVEETTETNGNFSITVCPHCNKTIPVLTGSKFCPFCTGDIRDKKDIALEKLNKLYLFVKEYEDGRKLCSEIADLIKEM